MKVIYKVTIPNTRKDAYDYEGGRFSPSVGARVWVPFREKMKLGVVTGIEKGIQVPYALKEIEAIVDATPLLTDEVLKLCLWISEYYQSPLSEVLALALPKRYREGKPVNLPMILSYSLAVALEDAFLQIDPRAKKQKKLLELLSSQNEAVSKPWLIEQGYNGATLQALLDLKLIAVWEKLDLPLKPLDKLAPPLQLNPEQQCAKDAVCESLDQYRCFLLQGITGSGKTEVYLQIIQEVLAKGRQVLVLVPEIGLTPQLVERFHQRIAKPLAVIHSSLNDTERQTAWQLAKEGKIGVLIGTRAAIFTPMSNLGLIIIDEEHDSSFKQMEGVRYSARDTALMRAHNANIPVVLGTATPSLETLYNAEQGKYQRLTLTVKAASSIPLYYQMVDLRQQPLAHGLARITQEAIEKHLKAGNQVLVFINRRGFSPVLLCHACGWIADCRACDTHLTLHKTLNKLMCHHCGLIQGLPTHCSSCKGKELVPVGVGTQRLEDYLQSSFPNYQVMRIDRDEVSGKHQFDEKLAEIQLGKTQLIIGTQMLAKGHHFPRLSLVVVVDADSGLYNQDFRALEKLGQLLTQVAGRAGREEIPGEVFIQTHAPQHPLLNQLIQEGYNAFAKTLLESRALADLPPFHYMALIRAQGKSQSRLLDLLKTTKNQIVVPGLSVWGPTPAPLAKKANEFRMQLLIKSPNRRLLKEAMTQLRYWLTNNKLANSIKWNVDVDPQDMS